MKKNLIKDLENLVGKDKIFSYIEDRFCYAYDATNNFYLPDAVVIPKSTEDVVKVVRYANQNKIPVASRGLGSGYTGGSVPIKGGIVVSLEQMNKILEINKEKKYGIVESGVVASDFAEEVKKEGLYYPPDPTSLEYSTLGGNVAECAGGLRGRKYGTTKNYVLGLEFVLSDGEVIKTGLLSFLDDDLYDLEGLLIASEGTLGIITKIAFRLTPLPSYSETVLAGFDRMEDAAQVVSDITKAGIVPSALEFIDGDTLDCVLEYISVDFVQKSDAVLLIEPEGEKEEVQKEMEMVRKICEKNNAKSIKSAETKEEKEKLWEVRRASSGALLRLAPTKVNEDVCVPPSQLPNLVKGLKKIGQDYKVTINTFGHAGDGNLHVNIMCDRTNSEQMERVDRAVEKLFDLTLKLGGTLSGEHGIGITKSKFLENEVGKLGIELMKKIKKTFDPEGIINPGKIFS